MSQQSAPADVGLVPSHTRSTRVRVRYADTDRMGVVYYANYLIWFEVGRTEWFRDTGWSYKEMERAGVSLPVIEVECSYRQPARYDDEIEIRTRGTLLSPVRIRFDYEVVRNGEELATGHTVHAALGRMGRPHRLPASVRDMLASGSVRRPSRPLRSRRV